MTYIFKPMLAVDATDDLDKLRFPLVASPKLDGIRCVVRDGQALSRSLKPIPNKHVARHVGDYRLNGLDGELMLRGPHASFQAVTSAVMGRDGAPDFLYHVFDDFTYLLPFESRYGQLIDRLFALPEHLREFVRIVPHMLVHNADELARYEASALAAGHEGVMLRDPRGPYKHGRSTLREGWLMKLKRFEDAEGLIIGLEEEMENTNEAFTSELGRTKRSSAKGGKVGKGQLGAFILRRADGVEFRCAGFTQEQKVDFWARGKELLGKIVTYKFQRHGSKDAPRSPVFKFIRDPRDL